MSSFMDNTNDDYTNLIECKTEGCPVTFPIIVAKTHGITCMNCIMSRFNSNVEVHNTSYYQKEQECTKNLRGNAVSCKVSAE